MTAQTPHFRERYPILLGGVIVLTLALLSIYSDIAEAQAWLVKMFFTVDPSTGLLIESRHQVPQFVFDLPDFPAILGTDVALVGIVIVAWGARRLGRQHGVRLELIASPVLAVLALGLVAGLLAYYRFEWELEDAFRALGGEPEGPDSCVRSMTPCSRVQALDRVWAVVVPVLCVVSASAFLLAARHAWRVGNLGLVLPRGWAYASIALFVVGATSLILTTPHARDLQQVAGQCEQFPNQELRNTTSAELQGMVVERCDDEAWQRDPLVEATVEFVVADAEGWVSRLEGGDEVLYFMPNEFGGDVGESIERLEEIAESRGEELPPMRVLALYIDERTSALALREHLRAAREAGITDLLLHGQAFVEGRSETQGEWTRRTLCPAGWIRFDDQAESALTDFTTWAELQRAAIDRGDEPLLLRLPITP